MMMLQLLLCAGLTSTLVFGLPNNENLINRKVERAIDLSSQLVKITSTITIENLGSKPTDTYVLGLDPNLDENLAFFGATATDNGDETVELPVKRVTLEADKSGVEVTLEKPLISGDSTKIEATLVYSHNLRPYPTSIRQSERQLVLYTGNYYFYSPYKTKSVTTTANLPVPTKTETFSRLDPTSQSENLITYGPYVDVEPFSHQPLTIHYENNKAFITITDMQRVIEVSHWGNIAVEETFNFLHSGATLKGTFSRYDYQRSQETLSAFKEFKMILPALAKDVYYRDEIGNISTSNLWEQSDSVDVTIRPRFPLFGGWKTHFTVGYNLPTYQYLFTRDNEYRLRIRLVDHVFDDYVVDRLEVKVILPERVGDIEVTTPYPVERRPDEVVKTYLDTVGRPVVVLRHTNLVENHIQDLEISYTFNHILLLHEPIIVVTALYVFFLLVIIYVRLDFSIHQDAESESRLRAVALVHQFLELHRKRVGIYSQYDAVVAKFKSSKDSNAFANARKKLDVELKAMNATLAETAKRLADVDAVAEIQRREMEYRDVVMQAIGLAEKVTNGRMTRPQYLDNEKANRNKREELRGKIDHLTGQL